MEVGLKNFSEKLKMARLKSGYTQTQLAEMVGIRSATLSAYENTNEEKRATPSLEVAVKICVALNVSLDYLCGLDSPYAPKSKVEEAKNYLYSLTKTLDVFHLNAGEPRIDYSNRLIKDIDGTCRNEACFGIHFPDNSTGSDFLRDWLNIWNLKSAGTLNNELYETIVESLCEKYSKKIIDDVLPF